MNLFNSMNVITVLFKYKFEDSQSLEVKEPLIWGSATNARVRIPKLSTRAGVNRTASAVRTPASAVRRKKTPPRASGKPSSRASVSKRVTAGVQSTKTPKQKQKKGKKCNSPTSRVEPGSGSRYTGLITYLSL